MTVNTICIYGAGALGGAIAAKLATSGGGNTVSVVARGPHLEAIRQHGLKLFEADAESPITARIEATDKPGQLPPQDLVITGLKGHQLPAAAEGIAQLLKDGTRVVMILNGIPWWYFHRDAGGRAEQQLEELDPGGILWRRIGPQRVIGCVAMQGAEVRAPGEISLSNNGRYILGEPSGEDSDDLRSVLAVLNAAGLAATGTDRIRDAIWMKLMGNAAFNPISALTRATMHDIMHNDALAGLVEAIMTEVRAVGEALGARFSISVEERLAQSRQIGDVRTSMLQDLLAGKSLELEPLVGIVVKLGQLAGVATPVLGNVSALASELDRQTGTGR